MESEDKNASINDSTAIRIAWSGMTDTGRFRKNNEDAFLALTLDGTYIQYLGKTGEAPIAENDFVFAVSDGMGGHNAGEFASKIAVEKIGHLIPKTFVHRAQGFSSGFQDILEELFTQTHNAINQMGQSYEECSGMGATLSLIWVTPHWIHFGHIGDSRIYYLPKEGGMKQLTEDHTHVGWLYRKGDINEREARNHPRRNVLSQSLGARNRQISPQVGSVGLRPGDQFLLCTDGIVDGHWDRALEELLRIPFDPKTYHSRSQQLVKLANENAGRDNATAVVIELS